MPEGQPREGINRTVAHFERVITAGRKPGHQTVVHLLLKAKKIDHMINPAA